MKTEGKKELEDDTTQNKNVVLDRCTLIRCISIVICLAIIMYTVLASTDKYIQAKYKSIDANKQPSTIESTEDINFEIGGPQDVPIVSDDDISNETTGIEADTSITSQQTDNASVTTAHASEKTTVKNKIDTIAEIVNYYTKSANDAKLHSKTIKQNYQHNYSTGTLDVGGSKVLAAVGNKLMDTFLGNDPKRENVIYSSAAEKNAGFTVEDETWASKLTANDVKTATCTEGQNGFYLITIFLKPDTTPISEAGEGHAGKGVTILKKADIVESGKPVPGGITNIALTYSDCKITAKINKSTGKMIYANYFVKAKLALRALATDCSLGLTFESDYTINW